MKLTKKQIKFAEEYIKTYGNATKSAINAGYSEKTAHQKGYQLKNDPAIRDYINQLTEEAVGERDMILLEIVTKMRRNMHFAERESDQNQSAKILTDIFGFNQKNVNLSGSVGLEFEALTDEELEEELKKFEEE